MKKLQGQLIAEQEILYGSKPSPSKPQSAKKAPRTPNGSSANRRNTFGVSMLQKSCSARKLDKVHQIEQINYLDDGISCLSSGGFLDYTPILLCYLHLWLAGFSLGKCLLL